MTNIAPPCGLKMPASGEVDPLYLFACSVEWRSRRSEEALWQLLRALTSSDSATWQVADAILQDCLMEQELPKAG
jgi:hypothetical protein